MTALPHRYRSAFTLVELLVTITIIVILASTVLFAMAGTQKLAKIQRAKAQVSRIHELIAEKWESYESRRVPPLASGPLGANVMPPPWAVTQGINSPAKWVAFDRLQKLREITRMDFPERPLDIYFNREVGDTGVPLTAEARFYREFIRVNTMRATTYDPDSEYWWGRTNTSAECLYLILSRMEVGESNGLEFFSANEIGDTDGPDKNTDGVPDGDGLPEILDPWGRPIQFVRWPTGFISPMQPSHDPALSDDPLDPAGVDAAGYFYFPVVFSMGPDREADVATKVLNPGTAPGFDSDLVNFSSDVDAFTGQRSPYYVNNPFRQWRDERTQQPFRLGAIVDTSEDNRDTGALDNVFSHFIETSVR